MKTGASLWPPAPLSKGGIQTLKVVSGDMARLDVGKIIETTVQKAEANTFRIMLKGEAFIVRGLPTSMLGRKINIMAQHSGSRLELAWLASTTTGKPGLQIMAGNTDQIPLGSSYETIAQKVGAEIFKIILKNEAFIVKGLPDDVAGTKITVTARQSKTQSGAKIEFEWAATDKQQRPASAGRAEAKAVADAKGGQTTFQTPAGKKNAPQKATQVQIHSVIPGNLMNAEKLSGRVSSVEAGRMLLQLTPAPMNHARPASAGTAQMLLTDHIQGMQKGQQISASIQTDSQNKAVLEVQAQVRSSELPPSIKHLKLAAGEMTMALVQKRLSNGNIRLNIRGASMETPAPASVKQGDALMLRMTKAGELEVIQVHKGMDVKAQAVLRNNLPTSNPVAQSISSIRNLLPSIAAGELARIDGLVQLEAWLNAAGSSREDPINGQRLATLIRDSGLNLESKLMTALQQGKLDPPVQQDLKAILLQIAELQADKIQNTALARVLAEMGQQGASRIEAGQALNMLANIHSEPYRFEFPMLINQQVTNVQLSFEQNNPDGQHGEGNEDSTDNSYNVLFALELSQLGKLRVDANISETSVYARIYNGNSEIQPFIQQHLHRLETRLHDLGYAEVYLVVSGKQPDSEKQARFDQLTTMTSAKFSLLDIRV